MRSAFLSLVVLGALGTIVACSGGGASPDDTATTDDRLQAGSADPNHPSVGMVWFAGGGFCTGTLIAPSVILTAGHCVQDAIDGFYLGQGTPTAHLGPAPAPGFTKLAVDKWIAHPSYSSSGGCPNTTLDIGLIHLTKPLVGVTPTPIATGGAPQVGASCEAVGYGTHTANGTDTVEAKRNGTEIVKTIAATAVEVSIGTALADHGDSGGPLICGGFVAGATSCHTDGDWPGHQLEYYARVDAAATWITGQTQAWSTGPTDAGVDTGTVGSSACSHNSCATGGKLVASCDPCVSSICATDAFCCANSWDTACVGEVKSICGKTCN